MRNQEAARYARWAATAAGIVALVVVAFYVVRAIQSARRHNTTAQVSPSVQQQMQTFTYNGMEGNRTLFTIRASRATEFRADSPALLEDVWISIYGRQGDRNDSIHTHECSYAQKTGAVQCTGEVTIDIRGAKPQSGAPTEGAVHVTTSDITFDAQKGEADSPAPVEFSLPQGHGSGVGISYQTRAAIVRVQRAVKFEMIPDARTGGSPVHVEAASMEVRRDDRKVLLGGPVNVQQGDRMLAAGNVTVSLGESFHARQVLAEGNPSMRASRSGDVFQASASAITADLSSEGWVEHLSLVGNVTGTRHSANGSSQFSSNRVEFAMQPARNILRQMIATGTVSAESQQGGISQVLKTNTLQMNFSPASRPDEQHVQTAKALGPSTIVMKDARETTEIRAPKFDAQFTSAGRLGHLVGGTGVDVRRTSGTSLAQTSTAQSMSASFAPDGQWTVVEETGKVSFSEGDRKGFAGRAKIDRASGKITLTGSPIIEDASSSTAATLVTLDQKSGELSADGGVVTTYSAGNRDNPSKSGAGPAHISADRLTGSTSSGHVVYSGHARLWQGDSVLEADRIAISRDQKAFSATGNVTTVFVQTSGASLLPASDSKKSGPTLWKAYAPELAYSGDQGQVHLTGGVRIVSGDVSLVARTLDLDLIASKTIAASAVSPLGGQLARAVARGDVVVRQGAVRATADNAVYTAADEKFVLSGGKPTITDVSGNSASGRSLTFFIPNDTILIDSQEGSRTLTKYRVEK
ncbi:MAG TPA: LptA/OstA family protein [Candidatus Acidoferrales bacterium]|nr:LptA/OstA family protein [Candidatus Acidoferrales bacterium]